MSTFARYFLFCFLSLYSFYVSGQCNDWEELIYYQDVMLDDVARDKFDNLYVVGSYHLHDFVLGPYHFTLPASGNGAGFIAKFDKNFSLVWATSPTTDRSYISEVELDADENIVVAGMYFTFIDFGCMQLTNNGRSDGFVAKYTANGDFVWVTAMTNSDDLEPSDLDISPNGNIIVSANFVERSSVTPWLAAPDIAVGGVPVITGAQNQVAAGYDSFVASIRPDGIALWTQGVGGEGNDYDYTYDVATDSQNNVIIIGFFSSDQIILDGLAVHGFTISQNLIVAKFDVNGQAQWVRESEGPADQGGYGVATDANDNIFIAGRFEGGTIKFGAFSLTNRGSADVFVAKLNAAGVPLAVRDIGDANFDSGTSIEIDNQGHVVVAAYYYSNSLTIGTFTSTKTEFAADSFVATLSNDLATVLCVRFITGDIEAITGNIAIDAGNNIWLSVMTDSVIAGPTARFGSKIINTPEVWTVIASLGNTPSPFAGTPPPPPPPTTVSLGPDVTICIGQKVKLSPGLFCGAQYTWSTGSTDASIEVTQAGTYWVDVIISGTTTRDDIAITVESPITVVLTNQFICPGDAVTWSAPVYANATYLWNDGSVGTSKNANTPGTYWVHITNHCQTVGDTVTLAIKPAPVVDLGNDLALCTGKQTTLTYTPLAGETAQWSTGSASSTITITEAGTYGITVSNGCGTAADQVVVTVKPLPVVNLGEDRQLCDGKDVVLTYTASTSETVEWSTGATTPAIPITEPGTYSIAVTNSCGTTTDEVVVTVKDPGAVIIPNVITPNGDDKNEHFQLPEAAQGSAVSIYNRWGTRIFHDAGYANTWPQQVPSTGTYFYTIQGLCIGERKGAIYVVE